MTSPIVPVILSGGSGSRLWPLSRVGFPKQFLCFGRGESLFQQAAKRLCGLSVKNAGISAPLIVCNEDHRFLVNEQLREIGIEPSALILEPVGRNTAPALTAAAFAALEEGVDPILVVTPADQAVIDTDAFADAMRDAICSAETGGIVILGISPDRPETGYGYIKVSDASVAIFSVDRFVEKPDAATASRYLQEGGYYWNAGIFVLKASVWVEVLQRFRPDIAGAVHGAWTNRSIDQKFVRPGSEEFSAAPNESVDYAVLERCPGSGIPIKMVRLNAGWSDMGSWDAVWSALPKDEVGNACVGDVYTGNTRNSLVHASSRLVCLVGVENLVVVETADAVLVADKNRSQDVKAIVSRLQTEGREEHTLHRKVHRPWGWYDGIDEGARFKVKRIQVKPQACLSLQKHHHRAEHWVVVKGTAQVTCGEKTVLLSENQSTYIPLGETHRLTNPGTIPLEIIEVQSGSYLGEDDIVRLEDHYGR